MKIQLHRIKVRELYEGYENDDELGVRAYSGRLDVRPPYQREFVYKDKQRDLVIQTLRNNFPLNVMYWSVQSDGSFEVIDGQQRTISICEYVDGDFSVQVNGHQLAFHNLQDDQKEQILDYELMVYFCEGSDSEKLDWFETINIAGVVLTDQELRNAVYHGPWVTAAKRYFSKSAGPAAQIGADYMSGSLSANRQEYLEEAIRWINNGQVDEYMRDHQQDPNADELWSYFRAVMSWVSLTFPHKRSQMKSVRWGPMYNKFRSVEYDPQLLEERVATLMSDPSVIRKPKIYEYLLGGEVDPKILEVRVFDERTKLAAYGRQTAQARVTGKSNCPMCALGMNNNAARIYELQEMDADHVTAWSKGGTTSLQNCEMLCVPHNRSKGNR